MTDKDGATGPRRVWLTADLHLGHERIIELAGRPFGSVVEHDCEIVDRWNAVVGDDDVVWILGDLAMGDLEMSLAHVAELRGRKLLISGNHDRTWTHYDRRGRADRHAAAVERYRTEGGINQVITDGHLDVVPRAGTRLRLCHFPADGDSGETDRYAEHRPQTPGSQRSAWDEAGKFVGAGKGARLPHRWLVHGHNHCGPADAVRPAIRHINVGVDAWEFTPVALDTITSIIGAHQS